MKEIVGIRSLGTGGRFTHKKSREGIAIKAMAEKDENGNTEKKYVITAKDIAILAKQQSKIGIDKAITGLMKLSKGLDNSREEENER